MEETIITNFQKSRVKVKTDIVNEQKRNMFLIKIAYWLGIGADALWAVGLLFLPVYQVLTGVPDFVPDFQTRQIMLIAGTLMTGWTFLLLWAIRSPIERRFVILLTAFPVVFGLFLVALKEILNGNTFLSWVLIKSSILLISMINSYILAGKMARGNE